MKWLLDNNIFFPLLTASHAGHQTVHAWLAREGHAGWGVTVETYLGGIRKLMNPATMNGTPMRAREAVKIASTTLAEKQYGRGQIVIGGKPDNALYETAQGHKQIMDFYLVQVARDNALRLVTRDNALLSSFPKIATPPI